MKITNKQLVEFAMRSCQRLANAERAIVQAEENRQIALASHIANVNNLTSKGLLNKYRSQWQKAAEGK